MPEPIDAQARLEERVRALTEQVRELEETTGKFQREASSEATMILQLEETLKVEEEARAKLALLVERQTSELNSWRTEAHAQKARADALEGRISGSEADVRRQREELQAEMTLERSKLLEEVKKAMQAAETVRREGIEALEQAQARKKK